MSEPAIEIASSRAALARSCADYIAAELRGALRQNGKASFVATGGSTPAECYALLAKEDLDWRKVTITLSDERWVDVKSDQSNEHMLHQTLLTGEAALARFIPLKGRRGGIEDGARAAEKAIAAMLPFDVTLLGMGEDGHFASLFPRSPALRDGMDPASQRLCVGVAPSAPAPDLPRVSLTLAALVQSRQIVLLVTGEAKRAVLAAPEGKPVSALLAQSRAPLRILWAA
jgi:6-phosphogluconolactonase